MAKMVLFITGLAAEIVLDLSFVNFQTLVLFKPSKLKTNWSWIAVLQLGIVTPFYLYHLWIPEVPEILLLPLFTILSIIGGFLLWRNAKLQGYFNSTSLPARRTAKGDPLKSVLDALDNHISTIAFSLAIVCISIFVSGFEIVQIPVTISSVLLLLVIMGNYYRKRIRDESRTSVTLSTLFSLTLLLSLLLFIVSFLYLYKFFIQNWVITSITAVVIISLPVTYINHLFIDFRRALILRTSEENSRSLIGIYSLYRLGYILIAVVFSDAPIVYSFLAGQNDWTMIFWMIGFVSFVFVAARNYLTENLQLELEAKLISREFIENRLGELKRVGLSL